MWLGKKLVPSRRLYGVALANKILLRLGTTKEAFALLLFGRVFPPFENIWQLESLGAITNMT